MFIEPLDARRLFATGLDTTFAKDGGLTFPSWFTPDTAAATSVEAGDNGSIFVSGASGDAHYVAKYDNNGRLITKFGSAGFARVPFEPDRLAYDVANGVLYVASNDAIANASTNKATSTETNVVRLRPSGKFDRAFGDAGVFNYRFVEPTRDSAFVSTTTQRMSPLADGSVLLAVDRVDHPNEASSQDLVLIKLRPNGTRDPKYGKKGVTELLGGHVDAGYSGAAADTARSRLGEFSDVTTDATGATTVVIRYAEGTRAFREDYPSLDLAEVGQFFVKSRVVSARGVVDAGRAYSWKIADNTVDQAQYAFEYAGYDGRTVHAALLQYGSDASSDYPVYAYTLVPGKKAAKQRLPLDGFTTLTSSVSRSANGAYLVVDYQSEVVRLRPDFTIDRTFGVNGFAHATNGTGFAYTGFGEPSVYADARGRVLAFEAFDDFTYLDRLD